MRRIAIIFASPDQRTVGYQTKRLPKPPAVPALCTSIRARCLLRVFLNARLNHNICYHIFYLNFDFTFICVGNLNAGLHAKPYVLKVSILNSFLSRVYMGTENKIHVRK